MNLPGKWLIVVAGVAGLIVARSWLREQYTQVIKAATTPDDSFWEPGPDWSESTLEFTTEPLVPTYNP